MTSGTDDDSSAFPLDIIHILLTTVVRPVEKPFRSVPFPIADHQRHIYSVTVDRGIGSLSSGSPVTRSTPEFARQVSTNEEDCPGFLKEIADSLKAKTEEVNDITIQNFVLQFGINESENNEDNQNDQNESNPYLLGCDGSDFIPSSQLEPYVSYMTIFTLFYAVEMSVNPIPSQCITRGKFCSAGTQSIERSKVVSYHISCIAQAIKSSENKTSNKTKSNNNNTNDDNNDNNKNGNKNSKDSVAKYLKSRINTLCPIIMMANVSVCKSCFKFYSIDASQPKKVTAQANKECGTATLSDHNRSLIVRKEQRPTTTIAAKRSGSSKNQNGDSKNNLPMVRAPPPPYMIGNLTKSGLRVASNNSTQALERARRTYNYNSLFLHVPPPKPEFKYKPKGTTL